jgi:hypothetical protein
MRTSTVLLVAAVLLIAAVSAWLSRRALRRQRHAQRLSALLDALDALEAAIKRYRERMLVTDAEVRSHGPVRGYNRIDPNAPMQEALRGVLQHRLWIRDHGATASENELSVALNATLERHAQLDLRLNELDDAVHALHVARQAQGNEERRLH